MEIIKFFNRDLLNALLALVLTVIIISFVIIFLNANPTIVFWAIINGSIGNSYFLNQTLITAGVLMLTGLAAVIPFSARLWNLGGEGQMTLGAVIAASLGVLISPMFFPTLSIIIILIISAISGGLLAAMCGYLKVKFNASEVVTTLMSNFIMISLSTWLIFQALPAKMVQRTISIDKLFYIPSLSITWFNIILIISIVICVLTWILIQKSRFGFSVKVMGANFEAAKLSGIEPFYLTLKTFALAGSLSGLAGGLLILGRDHALLLNFSSNYGFLGIGVALTAKLNPLFVIPIAFIFAMLTVGSNSLQAVSGLSPMIGNMIVALLVLSLMFFRVIKFRYPENING